MLIKDFFLPKVQNEIVAKKFIRLCAIYFLLIVTLDLVLASINFGTWSFKSSNTYFRILENLFVGFAIYRYWRTVVRIFLYLQIILVAYIFIGGHGLKIINTMSLIVLFYADFMIGKYVTIRNHITKQMKLT